jgi:hypothetical protein
MSLILVYEINVPVPEARHVSCPRHVMSLILVFKIEAATVHVPRDVSSYVLKPVHVSDFSFQNK